LTYPERYSSRPESTPPPLLDDDGGDVGEEADGDWPAVDPQPVPRSAWEPPAA